MAIFGNKESRHRWQKIKNIAEYHNLDGETGKKKNNLLTDSSTGHAIGSLDCKLII